MVDDMEINPTNKSDITSEEYDKQLAEAAEELKKISPEDYLSLQWYTRDLEEQIRMNDARARVNTVLYGEKGGQIFLEVKSVSISGAVQSLIEEVSRVAGKYGFSTTRPGAQEPPAFKPAPVPAPVSAPIGVPAPAAPATPSAPSAPQATPVVSQQASSAASTGEMLIVRMDFVPKPDKRGDLLFFQPRHRYKDIFISNWKIEDLIKMLEKTGAWSEEHFTVAASYNVNYVITWKEGRPSTSGTPYKDVIDIRLA